MANRKLLSQQSSRRTTEVQERKKAIEEKLGQLTPLQKTAPSWLDDLAKKEWNRILPLLTELKVAALDMAMLAMYCQTYSNYVKSTKKLERDMVIETERGTKLSSYYTVQRDSLTAMNSIAPKLGLTVESRLKIMEPVEEPSATDPFEGKLNGKKK